MDDKAEAKVEAERPDPDELILWMEAEANVVKAEAMAQRSYKVATLTPGKADDGDAFEAFILARSHLPRPMRSGRSRCSTATNWADFRPSLINAPR